MKYTPLYFGEARGSVAGHCHSRNRYGLYIRQKAVPTNPNSSRQQTVRNYFQTLTDLWNSTLTAAQRTAWNLYGASVGVLDKLGNTVYLTGFNHYIRSNLVRLQAGQTRVDDGPTDFTLPGADPTFAAAISEATQVASITFDNTLDWANEDDAALVTYCSQPRQGSREYVMGPFRYMDVIEGDAVTAPTSPDSQNTPFAVAQTQKVQVYGRISRADGRLSDPFRVYATVAA